MDIVEITTHEGDALARLAAQYRDKPLMTNVARLAGVRAQSIEDVLWDIYTTMGISTDAVTLGGFTLATGAQLDLLGKLVNLPRAALSDADYLLVLQAQILILFSSGSIPDLLHIFKILLPSATLVITESFPAGFVLNVGYDITNADLLASILRRARAAGVNGQLVFSPADPGATFQYDGAAGTGYDDGAYAGALI